MIAEINIERPAEDRARFLLNQAKALIESKPFIPHPVFKQGDVQTLAAFLWPLTARVCDVAGDEERLFEVEPGSQVLARCRWQEQRRRHVTLVLWHGLEGSAKSGYMLRTADKAFSAGFNVVRVNIRNCGETEHLTPTIYHAGLTADLRVVIEELIRCEGLPRIVAAGFSLGGNLVLKLAGEYGDEAPPELKAIAAVSPSVDLLASNDLLRRTRNAVYHQNFLYFLKRRIRLKEKLYPGLYDSKDLDRIRSINEFDDCYVAPAFGFENARDYYAKASSLPFISRIRVPTLIIHAKDDPFIPFAPLDDPAIAANPYVLVTATPRGGHVAFISELPPDEDRFWAENRLLDFSGEVCADAIPQ
jgi:predicted alpha/beta-fold hydrolase